MWISTKRAGLGLARKEIYGVVAVEEGLLRDF